MYGPVKQCRTLDRKFEPFGGRRFYVLRQDTKSQLSRRPRKILGVFNMEDIIKRSLSADRKHTLARCLSSWRDWRSLPISCWKSSAMILMKWLKIKTNKLFLFFILCHSSMYRERNVVQYGGHVHWTYFHV